MKQHLIEAIVEELSDRLAEMVRQRTAEKLGLPSPSRRRPGPAPGNPNSIKYRAVPLFLAGKTVPEVIKELELDDGPTQRGYLYSLKSRATRGVR